MSASEFGQRSLTPEICVHFDRNPQAQKEGVEEAVESDLGEMKEAVSASG